MKHFFMEIDGMTVTYGDIVEERLCDTIPYYVERDDGEGDFDFAQGSLPTCTPVKSKGFSESELWDIESLMRDNMHNIYDQIRGEGAWALERDANYNREAIMYITQSAEIASLERDLVAANKKIEEQDAEIEELKAKYEKLQAETAGKKAEAEACDFADAAARDVIDGAW